MKSAGGVFFRFSGMPRADRSAFAIASATGKSRVSRGASSPVYGGPEQAGDTTQLGDRPFDRYLLAHHCPHGRFEWVP